MGGDDELKLGEDLPEERNDSALPGWMEMEVDLVEKQDAFKLPWIEASLKLQQRVSEKVRDPGEGCLVAV